MTLLDRSDDSARARLLDNLAMGFALPKALAAALGIRPPSKGEASRAGGAWAEAWKALGAARLVDGELDKACERVERKDDAAQGTERDVGSERVRAIGEAGGGALAADLGGLDRHLDPGGRGRETGEEASEGGGEAGGIAALRRAAPAPANEAPRIEIVDDYSDDYSRVMAEAKDLYGPGRLGMLKWIDRRGQMMKPALHAMEPLWLAAFGEYYASGNLIMLARKGLRAGGSSSACPALTRCALLGRRKLDAGTIGVIPIMSATRDEADGRFVTIRSYLRACGLTPPKKKNQDEDEGDEDGIRYEVAPGGIEGTFRSRRSTSGGGVIAIQDRYDHRIQFRILPALVKHGVGYTGVAGFADESDLWPNDPEHHVNPAEKILDRISERFTTTYDDAALTDPSVDPGAEMLVFSASYNADSAFKRAVDAAMKNGKADPLTHLVLLGEEGARRDEVSRRRLAYSIGSTDARLLAPGNPASPDLPAWAFNPSESIEKCHAFSKGDVSRMLAKYGGRAEENASLSPGPLSGVAFPATNGAAPVCLDTVLGVAPPLTGRLWGRVVVGLTASGHVEVIDDATSDEAFDAARYAYSLSAHHGASVLAVAPAFADVLMAHLAAAYMGGVAVAAPVTPVDVYDGPTLRLAPLRTLYERGRLRHAPGIDALESALRSHRDDSDRNPRLEALLAAVTRLVACYPWVGAAGESAEPMRGPRLSPGFVGRGDAYEDDPRPTRSR